MKHLQIALFFLFFPALTFGQFPPPENLAVAFDYIYIGSTGFCEGEPLEGPAYCFYFSWDSPDTAGIGATLSHYQLYYLQNGATDTILVDTLQGNAYELTAIFLGQLWMTAVYSNPDGESLASNLVEIDDLPIGAVEDEAVKRISIVYERQTQNLRLENCQAGAQLQVFDLRGRQWLSKFVSGEAVSLSSLPSGIYIVQVIDKAREKIIIEKIVR